MKDPFKRVLVIGGKPLVLKKAFSLGLEVIQIQKLEAFSSEEMPFIKHLILLDYENIEKLIILARELYKTYPFDYAISFTEYGLLPAAYINEELNLRGTSVRTVSLLRDKWEMRRVLNSDEITKVRSEIGNCKEHLEQFGECCGYPFIIKPIDGAGSFGVKCINSPEELDKTLEIVNTLGISKFIMEEFLNGPEVSVEAFSFNGKHIIITITDKLTDNNFIETGHSMPTQHSLELQTNIRDTVSFFLDKIGLKDGPSHTELKLTAVGPKVIESHNRIGGDRIGEMVELAFGIDQVILAFSWLSGFEKQPLPHNPSPIAGVAIRFFMPEPGIIEKINGLDEASRLMDVVSYELPLKVGDIIYPILQSTDRVGHVLAKGKNVSDAILTCSNFINLVSINY